MAVRADDIPQFTLSTPLKWLGAAALCAIAAAAIARLRERAQQPKVPPMSDDWLRSHTADRDYHY
jgi:hypothetical protein